jgi:hypothetical protein
MAAVQPEPWLLALITNNKNSNGVNFQINYESLEVKTDLILSPF